MYKREWGCDHWGHMGQGQSEGRKGCDKWTAVSGQGHKGHKKVERRREKVGL